jgi:hypothetical protein
VRPHRLQAKSATPHSDLPAAPWGSGPQGHTGAEYGVQHRCRKVAVTEQLLHGSNVITCLQLGAGRTRD